MDMVVELYSIASELFRGYSIMGSVTGFTMNLNPK